MPPSSGKISRRAVMAMGLAALALLLVIARFVALPAYDRHMGGKIREWLGDRGVNVVEATYDSLEGLLSLSGVNMKIFLETGEADFHISQFTARGVDASRLLEDPSPSFRAEEVVLEWSDLTAANGDKPWEVTAKTVTASDVTLELAGETPSGALRLSAMGIAPDGLSVAALAMDAVRMNLPGMEWVVKIGNGKVERLNNHVAGQISLQGITVQEGNWFLPLFTVASLDMAKLRRVDALPFSSLGYDKAVVRDARWDMGGVLFPYTVSVFEETQGKTSFTLTMEEVAVPATLYGRFSPEASAFARNRNDEPVMCSAEILLENRFGEGRVQADVSLTAEGLAEYTESKTLLFPPSLLSTDRKNDMESVIVSFRVEEGDVTFTDYGFMGAIADVLAAIGKMPGGASAYRMEQAAAYEKQAGETADAGTASCYAALASLWRQPGQVVFSFRPAKPVPFQETLRSMFQGEVPKLPGLSAVYTALPDTAESMNGME